MSLYYASPPIQKNALETLRITAERFNDRDIINMRVWYRPTGTGDERPGKQGVAFRVALLPDVIAQLQAAERKLQEIGKGGTP